MIDSEEREVHRGREKRDHQNDRDNRVREAVTFHPVVDDVAPNHGEDGRWVRIRRWRVREYGCRIVMSRQNRSTVQRWDANGKWDCAPGTI